MPIGTAIAAPVYWVGNGPTDWDGANSWSSDPSGTGGSSALPTNADVATFSSAAATGNQVVNLNADRSVAGLAFNTTGATVTLQGGGTARTLQLGASGITSALNTTTFTIGSTDAAQAVNVSLQAAQTWSFIGTSAANNGIYVRNGVSLGIAGSHTLTLGGASGSSALSNISGVISDGGADRSLAIAMSPTDAGNRWTLSGNNTYTGATTVTNGALTVGHANALGATSAGTTISGGAGLFFRETVSGSVAEPLTISGGGPSTLGVLRNVGGTNTWSGPITANASSNVVIGSDGGTLTLTNTADITTTGSSTVVFTTNGAAGAGTVIVNGDISGSVSVSKTIGTGNVLTFGGDTKTYSGTTTISAGLFSLNTSISNTSAVSVVAGATLRGNGGSINPAATTTVNGTVGAGFASPNQIGTLSTGPLTLTATGTFAQDINTTTLAKDLINVTGNLTLDAGNNTTLAVNDVGAGATLPVGTQFTMIDYTGTWNGGLFKVGGSAIADDTGTFLVGANTFAINYNGGPSGNDVLLQVVVPEPSSAVLAVVAAGGLLARRRRRGGFVAV